MNQKKQFFIPKNYDKKFELVPGISGWANLIFVPIIFVDFLVFKHSPFSIAHKITIVAVTLGVPYTLFAIHPVRDNVSTWKHLLWKIKFASRQRKFLYRKEGYENVQNEVKITIKSESERIEETGDRKKICSRLDSIKGDRKRIADNSRQPNGPVPKSVSN